MGWQASHRETGGGKEGGAKRVRGASGWPVGREDVFFHPFLAINLLAGN